MHVQPAEQTILSHAILAAGRQRDEVATRFVASAVNNLARNEVNVQETMADSASHCSTFLLQN